MRKLVSWGTESFGHEIVAAADYGDSLDAGVEQEGSDSVVR